MTWKIEFEKEAAKEFKKLDGSVAKRIISFLSRIEKIDDPRSVGEVLQGSSLGGFWKYRVGDYRLICNISDKKVTVVIVKIGHRRSVYK